MLALLRTPAAVRRFLAASLQSSVGNAIGYIALLLLAYDMTHSAWAVAAVLLADCVPAIALGPFFGALADRLSRRMLVVTADLLRCGAFVALAFAGSLTTVIVLALVAGLGGALYQPAAKSALPGLAGDRADEAMGALVASWSAASMIGPALGAGLLVLVSPSTLLLVNAATFLVSAIALSRLPIGRPVALATTAADPAPDDDDGGVRAGLRAVRGVPGLGVVVAAGGAATLAFSLMNLAEPLLARAELKTGAAGFAMLVCSFGVGSTIGALRGRADGWAMLATLAGGGLALLASAFVPSVQLAAVTFFATGLCCGIFMSCEHQLVARLAPAETLGRVFGLKDSLDAAALCSAFVAGGLIASIADARVTFAVSGAAALLVAAVATVLLLRAGVVHRRLRRVSPAGGMGGLAGAPAEAGAGSPAA